MAFHDTVERGIDYDLCSYGTSRLPFRGPCRDPGGGYAVALGGSETFGRYVKHPFPDLIEVDIGICLNLGCVNAGPTAFPMGPFMNKGQTMRTGQTHMQHYLEPLLERVQAGEIDLSEIITHRGTLENGPDFYKTFRDKKDGCVKCIMTTN